MRKTQAVRKLRRKYPPNLLLSIAHLPRATFYSRLKQMKCNTDKYEAAKAEIIAICHENKGRYAYRRITGELRKRRIRLNRKTVQRLMKRPGLVCLVRMKKYPSYRGEVGKIAPNLMQRDFHADKPNQKRVTDVKEFSLFGQKLYLSPILDLYSRDLVGHTISDRPVLGMATSMSDKTFEQIPDGAWAINKDAYAGRCEPVKKLDSYIYSQPEKPSITNEPTISEVIAKIEELEQIYVDWYTPLFEAPPSTVPYLSSTVLAAGITNFLRSVAYNSFLWDLAMLKAIDDGFI